MRTRGSLRLHRGRKRSSKDIKSSAKYRSVFSTTSVRCLNSLSSGHRPEGAVNRERAHKPATPAHSHEHPGAGWTREEATAPPNDRAMRSRGIANRSACTGPRHRLRQPRRQEPPRRRARPVRPPRRRSKEGHGRHRDSPAKQQATDRQPLRDSCLSGNCLVFARRDRHTESSLTTTLWTLTCRRSPNLLLIFSGFAALPTPQGALGARRRIAA